MTAPSLRPGVTFETKVWEGDYRTLLDPRRLAEVIERNDHDFTTRVVVVNNVERPASAVRRCRRLVRAGVIDDFHLVDDLAQEALAQVGLSAEELGTGYRYSIGELVGLVTCPTEHLLHYSGDSRPTRRCSWLPDALDLLSRRPEVKAVNLVWNDRVGEVREEATSENERFWFGQGFSDQMYLVRTDELRQRIYHEEHPASERYPAYGGELFEKRVDSWLRNHGYLRATSKAGSYRHVNITPHRSPLRRLRGRGRGRG